MYGIIQSTIVAVVLMSLVMLTGCAPSTYPLATPSPSSIVFSTTTDYQLPANVIDERRSADKDFHIGILSATLINEGEPVDPVEFLARNVEKELKARGVNVSFSTGKEDGADVSVKLIKFRVRNHRASGFSPYYTFTTISADVVVAGKTSRVTAYFKNGKVPVWSFDEVIEPCYTIPINMVIKEFASKFNRLTANAHISDGEVAAIVSNINGNYSQTTSYLEVYKLGFGNNKRAIPHLVELTKHQNNLVRIAALSSLGTIGAVEQFDYLTQVYARSEWHERVAALKSIGDFGTPEAISFVKEALRQLQTASADANDKYIIEVASLYL